MEISPEPKFPTTRTERTIITIFDACYLRAVDLSSGYEKVSFLKSLGPNVKFVPCFPIQVQKELENPLVRDRNPAQYRRAKRNWLALGKMDYFDEPDLGNLPDYRWETFEPKSPVDRKILSLALKWESEPLTAVFVETDDREIKIQVQRMFNAGRLIGCEECAATFFAKVKQTFDPWNKALEKYPPGTKVKGKIRGITSYGALFTLEEGLDAMIHVSDISWTRKVYHPSKVFKKGDEVEGIILEIDKANQRISVGVKQLTIDPWTSIDQYYKVGDLITARVSRLANFGASVGLQHDIDGLVHISQVGDNRPENIKNVLRAGQEIAARIISIDKCTRCVILSIKAMAFRPEQIAAEVATLDSLNPSEDMLALKHALNADDK